MDAITFVQEACHSQTPITEAEIQRAFHVSRVLNLMLYHKWIKTTAEPGVYAWNTNFTIEAIVHKLWKNFGKDVKVILPEPVEIKEQLPESGTAKDPLEDLILKLLTDCEQYGITNKAQYLVDNLKTHYKIS